MSFLRKLRKILSIRVPNWVGYLCYTLLILAALALIYVLLFPEQVGNFIIEHDIKFLQ